MPVSYEFSSSSELNDDDDKGPNVRRSLSPARRNRQSTPLTPNSSVGSLPATRFSSGSGMPNSSASSFNESLGRKTKKWKGWCQRRGVVGLVLLVVVFFIVNSWMLYRIRDSGSPPGIEVKYLKVNSTTVSIQEELVKLGKGRRPQKTIYARLLAKAAHALAEAQNKPEPKDLWVEPYDRASLWKPCADQRTWEPSEGRNGYIMVNANGGINQQRVAVCNAVAVARILNATLVLPHFMYSSVWTDTSQFGDIYLEEHFINYLRPDIKIARELPKELQSLDLDAIGSVVSDADIPKEAKPSFYKKHILPILLRNRVVHFVGFGNRLASDPISPQVQRLRCRCNFHALRFVPKIQETGALLIQRMRQNMT